MIRWKPKEYLLDYYAKYNWDKTNFKRFYGRCRDRGLLRRCYDGSCDDELEECIWIKLVRREELPRWSKQFPEEFIFYHNYEWEKPSGDVFRTRLVNGYSMYDAIKLWDEFQAIKKLKRRNKYDFSQKCKKAWEDCKVRQLMAWITVERPISYIDIKYTREEANVFRKVFEDEIEKLEYETTLDPSDKAIRDRLTSLEKEFEVFQKHNFIS